MVVALTRRCNLRCVMCRTWDVAPEHPAMSVDQFGDLLRQAYNLRWLDLTGGELFVRKDAEALFERVLRDATRLRMLHFPTNGWFGDRVVDTARRVVSERPDLDLIITVSVDGPREVHDRVRGREGSFERAVETFERLRKLEGVGVYIGSTVTRENEADLDALGRVLEERIPNFSRREWHWNWVQKSEQFFRNGELDLRAKDDARLARQHAVDRGLPRTPVDVMELGFLLTLEGYLRGQETRVPCQSLRSTCFVSPEGDLYPCHVWERPLGNIFESSLAELWAARETRRARAEVERLDCGGCFTPCEAYPALAGAPVSAIRASARGAMRLLREGSSSQR